MSTILITGCSSGFGLSTARCFLDRGWTVVATMRKPLGGLFPESDRLRLVSMDVTDSSSIARAVEEVGAIDALVNNAGGGLMGALEGTSMDAVRQLFELNTLGTMAVTKAFLPTLRQRKAGVVVNVSSAVTLRPLPLLSAYTATKAAVEAFSECLALELEPFGIRVRLITPGRAPQTSFGAAARTRNQAGIPEEYAAWAGQALTAVSQSSAEVTTVDDVAEAVWSAVTCADSPSRITAGADAATLAAIQRSPHGQRSDHRG